MMHHTAEIRVQIIDHETNRMSAGRYAGMASPHSNGR